MPVRFDTDQAALALPASWLPLRCPIADPSMYEASVRKLETLARRLEGDDYLMARVEQMIATSRDGVPSLAEVAERLHVSSRTLGRRIKHAGTTYGDLLDGHRRERAEALLRDRNFSIAEVGRSLGYGDSANFARACRRWFGMAPREYRRHLLGT
jgi:AraC-like DNA-binding protein